MKDVEIENRLIVARSYNTHPSYGAFTVSVMEQIKNNGTFEQAMRKANRPAKWSSFLRYAKLHRAITLAILIAAVSLLSFSGYAYAKGTTPISLIKRWLSDDGNHVKVEYQGRTFEYGSKRTYSDAAITAYAELNTVQDLHFKASNAFQIPQNGIEYVSNPFDTAYVYPWVGTIERSDETTLYVRKQYIIGDKVSPSANDNQLMTLPRQRVSLFNDGEHADVTSAINGKVVMLFQDAYLEHKTGSGAATTPVKQFFVFTLTHTLDEIKEADQGNQVGNKGENDEDRPLFEPSWGGVSNICLDNGADECDADKQGGVGGESLYSGGTGSFDSNPNAIPFGEGVLDPSQSPKDLIIRNTQGIITEINASHIVIKSSSGTLWTLAYTADQQAAFSRNHRPLKVGDPLVANLIGSVYNLDLRQFDDQHIYMIRRY